MSTETSTPWSLPRPSLLRAARFDMGFSATSVSYPSFWFTGRLFLPIVWRRVVCTSPNTASVLFRSSGPGSRPTFMPRSCPPTSAALRSIRSVLKLDSCMSLHGSARPGKRPSTVKSPKWISAIPTKSNRATAKFGARCRFSGGEKDRWIPIERGRELASRIPGATLRCVAGAGHLVVEDAPEVIVAALLSSFIERGSRPES